MTSTAYLPYPTGTAQTTEIPFLCWRESPRRKSGDSGQEEEAAGFIACKRRLRRSSMMFPMTYPDKLLHNQGTVGNVELASGSGPMNGRTLISCPLLDAGLLSRFSPACLLSHHRMQMASAIEYMGLPLLRTSTLTCSFIQPAVPDHIPREGKVAERQDHPPKYQDQKCLECLRRISSKISLPS